MERSSGRWRGLAAVLAALASACAAPRPYGEGVELAALLLAGARAVDHERLDGHATYALELVTRERTSGWGYELGASYGAEDEGGPRDARAQLGAFSLGLRRSFAPAGTSARPYLAVGGAWVVLEHRLSAPRLEFEERGAAVYLRGGVLWEVGRLALDRGTAVVTGFDLRAEAGDDLDHAQVAWVLGFGH
jgi:hypothetical protein